MPRIKKSDRPKRLEIYLPESVYGKLYLELYSELEGKIPFGSMSALMTNLVSDWLRSRGITI